MARPLSNARLDCSRLLADKFTTWRNKEIIRHRKVSSYSPIVDGRRNAKNSVRFGVPKCINLHLVCGPGCTHNLSMFVVLYQGNKFVVSLGTVTHQLRPKQCAGFFGIHCCCNLTLNDLPKTSLIWRTSLRLLRMPCKISVVWCTVYNPSSC